MCDLGIINEKNPKLVVDPNKVDRARRKNRQECVENHKVIYKIFTINHVLKQFYYVIQIQSLKSLYFDGKKSATKTVIVNSTGTLKQLSVIKEHLVLIKEPGNQYISFVTPDTANAENCFKAIIEKLESMGIDLDELKVLGSDGCVVNVGHISGIMTRIETYLGRPLQRAICLLHLGELPFKKLYEFLFGKCNGPTDFASIGPELKECHNYPVAPFKKIAVKYPKMQLDGLSNDQRYLFLMALAVKSGSVPQELAQYKPGPLNLARWLTLASRILRFYVSQSDPSPELKIITNYVMKVYVPFWQAVKTDNCISSGSKHFFNLIKMTRYKLKIICHWN